LRVSLLEEDDMARRASRVDVVGPLEPFQPGFQAALAGLAYTPLSAANQLRLMRHLSIWLEERELAAADLVPEMLNAYLAFRRAAGYTALLSLRGLAPLLDYLRGLGVAPMPARPDLSGPLEQLLERYRCYLETERGLAASTVRYYLADARVFLTGWVDGCGSRLDELDAAGVTGFVVDQCACRSVGSAKILVTVLRSLLRFLLLDGAVPVDLSGAVPPVAGWRASSLPKAIGAAEVAALLASCGRGRVGCRNRAILLLLVRLGLRAVEVARLSLDDVDWRRGEVTIRGKGGRDERLPLPADVGRAVVNYLRRARPSTAARAVFINVRAPFAAMTAGGVKRVVVEIAARAGVAGVSAHRLRHTAATGMLRAQASLTEVGQVLRHRSVATTAIYAKVDRDRLQALAPAWPGVAR
jgi:integrase/recombinase XerD